MDTNAHLEMTALVVDDEEPARHRLIRLLEKQEGIRVVGEADNGLAALSQIEKLRPSIVFLDIEMPELNGLEVAANLGDERPALVFVTAFDQFAIKAFELAAIDYLVKPIAESRLAGTVERVRGLSARSHIEFREAIDAVMTRNSAYRTKVAVRLGSNYEVVEVASISAILAQEHLAVILSGNRELLSEESLDAIEKRLDSQKFFRCHRSAILNLDYLRKLERQGDRKYTAVLDDPQKSEVPISRERLAKLKARLELM